MANKLTTEIFIERARKVHGDRYDYSKVEYVNVFAKVRIICSTHGEFLQVARQHLKGRGCPECAGYNKWSYEACYEVAKQYQSRNDFKNNEVGAYTRALKNNWLKDYTWLDDSYHFYTEEECLKIARLCEYKKELITKYPKFYEAAKRRGWLKTYTWLKNAPSHPNIKWTYETCLEAAKGCYSKTEFETKYSTAMNLARKNGWLKEYTWFKRPVASNLKWSYDTCKQEAYKYSKKKNS